MISRETCDHILVVDNHRPDAEHLQRIVGEAGYPVRLCLSEREATIELASRQYLLSYVLHSESLDGFSLLRQFGGQQKMIVVSNAFSVDICRSALLQGAANYLHKPFDENTVRGLLNKCLVVDPVKESLIQELKQILIGESPLWVETLRRVAEGILRIEDNNNKGIFLCGPSGTGKGLIAKAIHQLSKRQAKPFEMINVSTLNKQLLNSELFGHQKGAFTGAYQDQPGLLQQTEGGILFLDEIGTMSSSIQKRLLHVLDTNQFRPMGHRGPLRTTNVRLIFATNENLIAAVKNGDFREDLFYRLNRYVIRVPSLAERGADDKLLLLDHFLKSVARPASPAVREFVREYPFPGNVRQLENLILNANGNGLISPKDIDLEASEFDEQAPLETNFPQNTSAIQSTTDEFLMALRRIVSLDWKEYKYKDAKTNLFIAFQRCYLEKWLTVGHNMSKLSELTGLSRKQLDTLFKKYNFRRPRD